MILDQLGGTNGAQHPDNHEIARGSGGEDKAGKQEPMCFGENGGKRRADARREQGQGTNAVCGEPARHCAMSIWSQRGPVNAEVIAVRVCVHTGLSRAMQELMRDNSTCYDEDEINGMPEERKRMGQCSPTVHQHEQRSRSTGTMATGMASRFTRAMDMLTSRAFAGVDNDCWFMELASRVGDAFLA
jgi:hypothetical protein